SQAQSRVPKAATALKEAAAPVGVFSLFWPAPDPGALAHYLPNYGCEPLSLHLLGAQLVYRLPYGGEGLWIRSRKPCTPPTFVVRQPAQLTKNGPSMPRDGEKDMLPSLRSWLMVALGEKGETHGEADPPHSDRP